MATFKHVWQYIDGNGSQFQEVYYHTGSSISGELESIPQKLVDARLSLMHSANVLQRVRISDITGQRNTGQKVYQQSGTGLSGGNPAPPGVCMVIQLSGTAGGSRHLWMRGGFAKDVNTTANFRPAPTGQWNVAFEAWSDQVAAYQYGILTRQNKVQQPPFKCTQVDGMTTPGQAVMSLTGVNPGWAVTTPPTQVLLGRFNKKDLPALNGIFNIVSAAWPLIGVNYATPLNAKITTTVGQARLYVPNTVSPFDRASIVLAYIGTRITKTPYSASRGARRAQRIRGLA